MKNIHPTYRHILFFLAMAGKLHFYEIYVFTFTLSRHNEKCRESGMKKYNGPESGTNHMFMCVCFTKSIN